MFDIGNDQDVTPEGDKVGPDGADGNPTLVPTGVHSPSIPNLPAFIYDDRPDFSDATTTFPPEPNSSRGCGVGSARAYTFTTQANGSIMSIETATEIQVVAAKAGVVKSDLSAEQQGASRVTRRHRYKGNNEIKQLLHTFSKVSGLTLVELVMVIAVIAVLLGIAVPSYRGYVLRANRSEAIDILLSQRLVRNACTPSSTNMTRHAARATPQRQMATTPSRWTPNPQSEFHLDCFSPRYTKQGHMWKPESYGPGVRGSSKTTDAAKIADCWRGRAIGSRKRAGARTITPGACRAFPRYDRLIPLEWPLLCRRR